MMKSVLGFIILKFILWIFPSRKIEDVSGGRERNPRESELRNADSRTGMTGERTHGRSAAAAGGGVGGGRGGTAALGPFKAWPCLARTPVAWAAGIEAEVGVEAKGVEDERRTCVGIGRARLAQRCAWGR